MCIRDRAYAEGEIARHLDDPDVVAFRWRMSSSHPIVDICDVYANADLYGLGRGVYPVSYTHLYYIDGETLEEIAESFPEKPDVRTIKRYIARGIEELSVLLWGVIGLNTKLA